jgi:hypothetical protein
MQSWISQAVQLKLVLVPNGLGTTLQGGMMRHAPGLKEGRPLRDVTHMSHISRLRSCGIKNCWSSNNSLSSTGVYLQRRRGGIDSGITPPGTSRNQVCRTWENLIILQGPACQVLYTYVFCIFLVAEQDQRLTVDFEKAALGQMAPTGTWKVPAIVSVSSENLEWESHISMSNGGCLFCVIQVLQEYLLLILQIEWKEGRKLMLEHTVLWCSQATAG